MLFVLVKCVVLTVTISGAFMTIRDIIEILGGRVLVNSGDLDAEVPRGDRKSVV